MRTFMPVMIILSTVLLLWACDEDSPDIVVDGDVDAMDPADGPMDHDTDDADDADDVMTDSDLQDSVDIDYAEMVCGNTPPFDPTEATPELCNQWFESCGVSLDLPVCEGRLSNPIGGTTGGFAPVEDGCSEAGEDNHIVMDGEYIDATLHEGMWTYRFRPQDATDDSTDLMLRFGWWPGEEVDPPLAALNQGETYHVDRHCPDSISNMYYFGCFSCNVTITKGDQVVFIQRRSESELPCVAGGIGDFNINGFIFSRHPDGCLHPFTNHPDEEVMNYVLRPRMTIRHESSAVEEPLPREGACITVGQGENQRSYRIASDKDSYYLCSYCGQIVDYKVYGNIFIMALAESCPQ